MAHWLVIVGSPVSLLTAISAGYALVPWACAHQRHGVIDLVIALALAATVIAIGLEVRHVVRVNRQRESPVAAREVFLSQIGIAVGLLCAVGVIAQWTTRFAVGPCVS